MMEEAVRLILGVDKNSIKDMYSLLKKKYNPQNKPVSFAENELLEMDSILEKGNEIRL
ncbi:hypothetical protein ACTGVM_07360 [Streptococcus suis]|uniref:hypothetical protein n=1 Tax=Streptococcus suis TaxID=1307 RepID=UPI0038BB81C7